MNFGEAVAWLYGFADYEFTPLSKASVEALNLRRLRSLLARMGGPQLTAKTVHVTGSKGKGSTATMVAALLRATGANTGLYTSPHLDTVCERINIDGEPIAESEFAEIATLVRSAAELENAERSGSPLTTFELMTALAFLAFSRHDCDWQVIEVGMGGRLDATNVLDKKDLCIFTPISLEHTAILGSTTAEIAADKAGILRRGARAVLALQDRSAKAVLGNACEALDVAYESVDEVCDWSAERRGLDGQTCVVGTPRQTYRFFLPVIGAHQVENAAAALLAIENLQGAGIGVSPEQAAAALGSVRWPGRLEVLRRDPVVIVDGAHNGASAARLAETLRDLAKDRLNRNVRLVIGTLADKDLPGIVGAFAPVVGHTIAVQAAHPRARPAVEIATAFAGAGVATECSGSVEEGLRQAIRTSTLDAVVCVAGSLYVVAEARSAVLSDPKLAAALRT
jgi:dihydrofolate synthase/folylpolyglutamate synthase